MIAAKCEICGKEATHYTVDIVEISICYEHYLKYRDILGRTEELYIFEDFAYIDRGRVSGEVFCPTCNRKYYDHQMRGYMNLLCDGSVVKL